MHRLASLIRPNSGEDTRVDWRRLARHIRPYAGYILIALVAMVLATVMGLIYPLVTGDLIDSLLEPNSLDLLNQTTLLLLLVFLLRTVLGLIQSYALGYVGEHITFNLRLQLYERLQQLSLSFFEQRRVGELVSRLSSDVTMLRSILTSNLSSLLEQLLTLGGALLVMLSLNWRLSLFILVLAPVVAVTGRVFGMWLRRYSRIIQDELASSTIVAEEVFQNIRVVKSFTREPYESQRYRGANTKALRAAIRLLQIRSVFSPLISFLGLASIGAFLWFGGQEVIAGRLGIGDLVTFMIYGQLIVGSIGGLVGLYASLQQGLGGTKRVFDLIDETPQVQDASTAIPLPPVEGHITFENVSFHYATGDEVLHGINLEITPGEVLALVGPSGAGKSTIFNLIPRFYDPTSGRVCIDGIDLRTVQQESLRAQIGIVPQETLLFGGTIEENIRYGRLDAAPEEVIDAARAANAHQFITALPDGYDTIVGERGVKLSGGQRQRIAIARTILKDPRILLLDEATSSLDSESEQAIQEALTRLLVGRTTIMIAHRLSTVRIAHRIAVLDAGRIVEAGTHDELMEHNGLYAKLYALQFRETLAPNGATVAS
ncbi:MAG TPA: ABC transporter ATP-binding protein [Oceanobacillus sp.]|nr:ABC transporter ATP-binding protein [Oceanobacillus sp.]